uniref:WD_REPEATS_REGION domain-containing protein n=1 Tax=Steinernema glaseri TaxID=37863 RepID=A0A1I7Y625_9BILA
MVLISVGYDTSLRAFHIGHRPLPLSYSLPPPPDPPPHSIRVDFQELLKEARQVDIGNTLTVSSHVHLGTSAPVFAKRLSRSQTQLHCFEECSSPAAICLCRQEPKVLVAHFNAPDGGEQLVDSLAPRQSMHDVTEVRVTKDQSDQRRSKLKSWL